MIAAADPNVSDDELREIESSACPTCGSCAGMFTANSMNCLTEALGLALPGNGTTLATRAVRRDLFVGAGELIVDLCRRCYEKDDDCVLPRSIASRARSRTRCGRHRHGRVDQHRAAPAGGRARGRGRFRPRRHRRAQPGDAVHLQGGAAAPATTWRTSTGPAESRRSWVSSTAPGCSTGAFTPSTLPASREWLAEWDVRSGTASRQAVELFSAAPGGVRTTEAFSSTASWDSLDTDAAGGCIRRRRPRTASTGAWPSCAATWLRTERSSRPLASHQTG